MRSFRFRWLALALAPTLVAPARADLTPRFAEGSVWHRRVDQAPLHPQSAAMLAALQREGGWGNGDLFQIDFSLHVRVVAEGEPVTLLPVQPLSSPPDGDSAYYEPDCEAPGTEVPVPADAAFEGRNGLLCDNANADCHLLIARGGLLYEVYKGTRVDDTLEAQCLAVWDLNVAYPPEGRGEHCTSADAAGFPIAALMPSPDAVAALLGREADVTEDTPPTDRPDLGHAIRFILPNARMASQPGNGGVGGRLYVRPASHAGAPSGPADVVPYGVRMRLRANFDLAPFNFAQRIILRTMQRYGIVLADGGNIALTFASDRHNAIDWSSLGVESRSFAGANGPAVRVTDFEVIDTGPRIPETYDCLRTPIVPGERVFRDGFEEIDRFP